MPDFPDIDELEETSLPDKDEVFFYAPYIPLQLDDRYRDELASVGSDIFADSVILSTSRKNYEDTQEVS